MASAHIEVVATASRLGAEVRALIDTLQRCVDSCDKIKAVADQVAMSSDWPALALKLGTSEADAQSVYNLLGSVSTELHGTFIAQALARLG
jgi:hypothetical protein